MTLTLGQKRRLVGSMIRARSTRYVAAFGVVAVMLGTFSALFFAVLSAAAAVRTNDPAAVMAKAASSFLASLSDDQKSQTRFPFDAAARQQWHFVPKDRTGMSIKAMSPAQRQQAFTLLKAGLSATGFKQTASIMSLEAVLAQMENNPVRRDPEKYHVSIFGTPSVDGTWAWKFEGHHVSLNFTIADGVVVATTPLFLGANPGEVKQGPRTGTRVLGREEDRGRSFLLSLSEAQRQSAVFDRTAPPDIVTGPASEVEPLAPVGVAARTLSASQREALLNLLKMYAKTLVPALATARLQQIHAAGIDKVAFAWAGGFERGAPHYYRISGPTFIVEYDNTQDNANHVHTVWRDYGRDFGRDVLREHLKANHL